MKIDGYEYRFVHIPDPPFPYGFGMDDPEFEYWVKPAYGDNPTLVWYRTHLPIGENGEKEEWVLLPSEHPLYKLGDMLAGEHAIRDCRFNLESVDPEICCLCASRGGHDSCPMSQPLVSLR